MIVKHLKFNLKTRVRNLNYIAFRFNKKTKGNDLHHLIGSTMGGKKLNDYLLAEIPAQYHSIITNQRRPNEYEELSMLTDCLEGIFDYVEHLESENKRLSEIVKASLESRKVIVELFEDKKDETNTKAKGS